MLAFQSLAAPTGEVAPESEPITEVERPFVALAASLSVIIGSAAVFGLLAPHIAAFVGQTAVALDGSPTAYVAVAAIVVAVNLFEAGVHVVNAVGLWFNRALSRRPLVLRLSQHVEHLSRHPRKTEYLVLNALDALAFAAAFAVTGEFNLFWAIVFAPHLATMVLAAWELDVFLKLFLLDIRRYLPPSATGTPARRTLLRGHLFMRGAFVLMDAVARTVLCAHILLG
jgi:hypothetical protein